MARKNFENSRERFVSLAEDRTNKVIKSLLILSHCSNKALYDYRESEIEKIFSAIEQAVIETKLKFKAKERVKFKL